MTYGKVDRFQLQLASFILGKRMVPQLQLIHIRYNIYHFYHHLVYYTVACNIVTRFCATPITLLVCFTNFVRIEPDWQPVKYVRRSNAATDRAKNRRWVVDRVRDPNID